MRVWLIVLFFCLPISCARREPPAPPILPAGELSQRSLLPADPYADARRALAERAAARERRFREAYEPGSMWRWLRVEQADIDAGRIQGQALLDIGRALFAVDFTPEQGLGNGLAQRKSRLAGPRPAPNLRHVQYKEFGGPDGTRCLSCHHVGGDGGGGFRSDNSFLDGDGERPASALERNPRAIVGAAIIQKLAEEMTAELRQQLDRVRRFGGASTAVPLVAKGISFGTLRLDRAGRVDPSAISGVDADLVVRPFGWKGDTATLREAVEQALQKNLGVQPERWINDPRIRSDTARVGDGPRANDPDHDGVVREATDGMVTALVTYLASLAPPIEAMPEDPSFLLRASRGAELFEQIGCAGCHVPELPLDSTVVELGPRPGSGRVDLAPLLTAPGQPRRARTVRLYSDLRRHDMGDSLAEPRPYRGVSGRLWLTPPLWGIAASGPYMHDGRATNLDAAILAHDGEGRAAREAYSKLHFEDQGALNLFLTVLDRPHHMEFRR
ncbi:MAG: di-heme oxidoredictase family protein [Myxococcales bacterium]|nr:di-heme oxidoredictase family protein [Myxococcales bacterium]